MPRKLLIFLVLLLGAVCAFSQGSPDPKKKAETEKLRKDAVEFLRQTSEDVNRMRSVENRIGFSAELASLMWFYDEKEAKALYALTIGDFNQLLAQFDSLMNLPEPAVDDEQAVGGLFGSYGKSPVERKFRIAMAVRQQIALSLAEHDADLAYNFFLDSAALVSNPQFRKEIAQSDKYFASQLLKQIADTNAARAAELSRASLKDGVEGYHVDLLKKIYEKDTDKGIEFGSAILSRLKSGKKSDTGFYIYSSLLSYGSGSLKAAEKTGGKKPVFSLTDLRDLAEQFAQAVLDSDDEDGEHSALAFAEEIEKFSPGRAAQIRAKFKRSDTPLARASNAAANVASYSGTNSNSVSSVSNSADRAERESEGREKASRQMLEDLKTLGKPLAKEEREKVVAQARKVIAQTPGTDKKILGLSLLAARVAALGDKDLADEIMRDAERLVNPQPKHYRDFLYTWMLASGYAQANPQKAFPLIEDAILRANETIAAFVKVAEFIDVNEEMVADGEVQVGMFGGSMMRGLTKELGQADSTLISLVKADFGRTKALTNSFDRLEIRVLAKMLVLRAILDDKPKEGAEADTDSVRPAPVRPPVVKPNSN